MAFKNLTSGAEKVAKHYWLLHPASPTPSGFLAACCDLRHVGGVAFTCIDGLKRVQINSAQDFLWHLSQKNHQPCPCIVCLVTVDKVVTAIKIDENCYVFCDNRQSQEVIFWLLTTSTLGTLGRSPNILSTCTVPSSYFIVVLVPNWFM